MKHIIIFTRSTLPYLSNFFPNEKIPSDFKIISIEVIKNNYFTFINDTIDISGFTEELSNYIKNISKSINNYYVYYHENSSFFEIQNEFIRDNINSVYLTEYIDHINNDGNICGYLQKASEFYLKKDFENLSCIIELITK